jgi:hypothetical protein
MPSRVAAASAMIVSARGNVGSKAPIPSRSRSSRTRTVVQAFPSAGLHRIRFIVTASSRSGNWPPSLRIASRARVAIARVAAGSHPRDPQFGVTPAVPMDRDERLVGRLIAVAHDFPDQDVRDPLLGSGISARRIPPRRRIAGERHQRRAIDLGAERRGNVMPGDAILDMGDPLQRRIPPGLAPTSTCQALPPRPASFVRLRQRARCHPENGMARTGLRPIRPTERHVANARVATGTVGATRGQLETLAR